MNDHPINGAAQVATPTAEVDPSHVPQGTSVNQVFDVFCNLAPNSPWTTYLRRIQEVFNHLAEGAVLIDSMPDGRLPVRFCDTDMIERNVIDESAARQWNQGIEHLMAGLALIRPVPKPDPEVAAPSAEGDTNGA